MTEGEWQRRLLDYASFIADNALAPDFYRRIAERFQEDYGGVTALTSYDQDDRVTVGPIAVNWDPAWLTQYSRHYLGVNPFIKVAREQKLENCSYVMSRVLPRKELARTEYYNDFMRPQGLDYVLTASFGSPGAGRTSLGAYRGSDEGGDFDSTDVRRLEALRPFLTQAFQLRDLHEKHGGAASPSAADLDRPALLILQDGAVRALNAPGEAYLRRKRRLRSLTSRELVGLLEDDRGALFPATPAGNGNGGMMAILDVDDAITLENKRQRLASIFGLTRRESEIAVELLRGDSNATIAARLGIGVETVRTFVRRIHHKSGTESTKRFIRVVEDLL